MSLRTALAPSSSAAGGGKVGRPVPAAITLPAPAAGAGGGAGGGVMEPFDLDLDSSTFTESRIFRAIKRRNHHKLLQALQAGENVHLTDHEFHSNYLHVLCSLADGTNESKYLPMVYQLSNAGIDVNARDYKGRTALELAIGRELQDIMAALLRCGADPTAHDYKQMVRDNGSPFEYELVNTLEKYEPGLWSCVRRNDTGMVHMLVNSWCRVNITKDGLSLLQMARHSGKSAELISVLDDYEVTIEFVHATLAGDEKRMLEFLMDSKPCDPNIMDISYQERWSLPLEPRSLRDTAFCMGHTHILHLLPEDEADDAPPADADQRPCRHIRDKGRTATVMAITSLNGYMPDGDMSRQLGGISEDEDDDNHTTPHADAGGSGGGGDFDVIREVPDEQALHAAPSRPTTARSAHYRPAPPPPPPKVPLPPPQRWQPSEKDKSPPMPRIRPGGDDDGGNGGGGGGGSEYTNTFGTSLPISFGAAAGAGTWPAAAAVAHERSGGPRDFLFHEVDSFVEHYYVEDGTDPPFKTHVCRPNDDLPDALRQMRKTDKRSTRSKMCVIS